VGDHDIEIASGVQVLFRALLRPPCLLSDGRSAKVR
jgi:hypothetical protein